jgi:hypothetical protein
MKSLIRIAALVVMIAMPMVYNTWLAIDTHKEIHDINRVVAAIMDLQVRTFHYAVGHKGRVTGCRECYKDVYEYLKGLEKEHPELFLD